MENQTLDKLVILVPISMNVPYIHSIECIFIGYSDKLKVYNLMKKGTKKTNHIYICDFHEMSNKNATFLVG
jgi:hypothetical protein